MSSVRLNSDSSSAKPFVKWVGGKTQLLETLMQRLPADFTSTIATYIEPFVGGGAFLFCLLRSFQRSFKRVIINDANHSLITTYTIIRDNPSELIDALETIENGYYDCKNEDEKKAFYYQQRDNFNSEKQNSIEMASNFIFLNRTCFNGLYRVNSKGSFNVPHGRYARPLICDRKTIKADSMALENVDIINVDFTEAVSLADAQTFVYFDPPYRPLSVTSSFCSYSEDGFDDNDQRRLANCCRELDDKGTKWLLSNSDPKGMCPDDNFFDELYAGFNIQRVLASRMVNSNATKRGKIGELLISNY